MFMNDELSAWTAALRSGEYIQGHGAMCQKTSRGTVWCPLGVLVNEIWDGYWVLSADGVRWGIETPTLCLAMPPVSVTKVSADFMLRIIRQNDLYDWSFRDIAEWLEGYRDVLTGSRTR